MRKLGKIEKNRKSIMKGGKFSCNKPVNFLQNKVISCRRRKGKKEMWKFK
jgi:hypothetical protein